MRLGATDKLFAREIMPRAAADRIVPDEMRANDMTRGRGDRQKMAVEHVHVYPGGAISSRPRGGCCAH
jgi:hypothetical protein